MEEQFCTYKVSSQMKKLHFAEECLGYYSNSYDVVDAAMGLPFNEAEHIRLTIGISDHLNLHNNWESTGSFTKAPLWQQAFDWLERQGVIVKLDHNVRSNTYSVSCWTTDTDFWEMWRHGEILPATSYASKYEAREVAILKGLKLCRRPLETID